MSGIDHQTRVRWFEDVVQRHEGSLVRYVAKRVGEIPRAQDIVQDAFLQLWVGEPAKLEGRLPAWLYKVCRNCVPDVARKESQLTAPMGSPTNHGGDIQANSDLGFELQVTSDRVAVALGQLTPSEEEVIRLKFQDGLSYGEMSEIVNLSVFDVGCLIHTGMSRMCSQLATRSDRPMAIDSGTPELTAWILDELEKPERRKVEGLLVASPELQQVRDDTHQLIDQLLNHFASEPCPHLTADQRCALISAITGDNASADDESANATFDPYHKWLAITPQEQPADAYRLLGIQRFEQDADVIANAADRQMAHVKLQATGPHAQVCQRILNELAQARQCLLDSHRKAHYDRSLQTQPPPPSSVLPPPVAPLAANVDFSTPEIDLAPADNTDAIDRTQLTSSSQSRWRGEPEPGVFDPYHTWLGIPPEEQPPDHYRLLGLPVFTIDPGVIERAANQQLANLRSWQDREHAVCAEQLLSEVTLAQSCLLDPEIKATYDAALRCQLAGGQQSPLTHSAADSSLDPSECQMPLSVLYVEPSVLEEIHLDEAHGAVEEMNSFRFFPYRLALGLAGLSALVGLVVLWRSLLWRHDWLLSNVRDILLPVVLAAIIVSGLVYIFLLLPAGQRWIAKRWEWTDTPLRSTTNTTFATEKWMNHVHPLRHEFPGSVLNQRLSKFGREIADFWQLATHTPLAIAILLAVLVSVLIMLLAIGVSG